MDMSTAHSADMEGPKPVNVSSLSGSTSMDELRSFIRIEKCPLCERTGKNFYCRLCVKAGDFGHSRDPCPTRFADRKLQLFRVKHEIINYAIAVEDATAAEHQLVQLGEQREAAERRLCHLRAAVQQARGRIGQLRARLNTSRRASHQLRERQPRLCARLAELRQRQQRCQPDTSRLAQRLDIFRHALTGNVRGNVRQLVTVVFPVSEVGAPAAAAAPTETESALAEAQSLAYVRGRWVYLENAGELQYRVVEPTLPDSGDYSAYNVWAAANQDQQPGVSAGGQPNPVYNLSAALTYTAQLVSVLAFYMDVRPPHRLCYSEFCRYEMTEREFNYRVAKLNANVLYLCLCAGVEPGRLEPRRTVYNLRQLLGPGAARLGWRAAPLLPPDRLLQSMEESLRSDLDYTDPLETEEPGPLAQPAGPSDDDTGEADWEQVPVPLDLPASMVGGAEIAASTSVASGLVSTVASFLRGFNR